MPAFASNLNPEHALKTVTFSGSGYELGIQHGDQLKKEIAEIIRAWKINTSSSLDRDADLVIKDFLQYARFDETIKKWTPELYEEVRGIAEGSGQELNDIMVLNLLDEFWEGREYDQSAILNSTLNTKIMKSTLFLMCLMQSFAIFSQDTKSDFNAAKGNAAIEVIIPAVDPVFFSDITKHGGDPSILIRYTTLIVNSWFDAVAPYHPTAVAVYSNQERQNKYDPADNTDLNIALTSASKVILDNCFPGHKEKWQKMMQVVIDGSRKNDISNAMKIGEIAGKAVWEARVRDGMNHDGREGGRMANLLPFSDYTGYEPVNTPYKVNDPNRWQPAIVREGEGKYKAQVFVTPQYGKVTPYTKLWSFDLPLSSPAKSDYKNFEEYKKQADDVLQRSREMTDEQKMLAEFFENKLFSLPVSAVVASQKKNLDLMSFIHLFFTQEVAIFDSGIWVWAKKREFDAVRPFTAISYLYGDSLVEAWAGEGNGVRYIPADNWQSYLPVADHPEYPSASACLCMAHATAVKATTNDPNLGWTVAFEAGSSFVQPEIVPSDKITYTFETWDDFAEVCGKTRLWSGVHFEDSVKNIKSPCKTIGLEAKKYVDLLISGVK